MAKITNTNLYFSGQKTKSKEKVKELQEYYDEVVDERLIRTDFGSAEIYLKNSSVSVTANGSNGMIINENGTLIDGKIHLAPNPSEIRIGGFWVLNDEILTTLPSTIYTPISTLVYSEPNSVKNVQALVKILKGMG